MLEYELQFLTLYRNRRHNTRNDAHEVPAAPGPEPESTFRQVLGNC